MGEREPRSGKEGKPPIGRIAKIVRAAVGPVFIVGGFSAVIAIDNSRPPIEEQIKVSFPDYLPNAITLDQLNLDATEKASQSPEERDLEKGIISAARKAQEASDHVAIMRQKFELETNQPIRQIGRVGGLFIGFLGIIVTFEHLKKIRAIMSRSPKRTS